MLVIPVSNTLGANAVSRGGESIQSAGYITYLGKMHKAEASGSLVVPRVTCTKKNAQFIWWVGLAGYKATHRISEQIGVRVTCQTGQPSYSAVYQLLGHPGQRDGFYALYTSKYAVHVGDTITALVRTEIRASDNMGTYVLALKSSRPWDFTLPWAAKADVLSRSYASWLVENRIQNGSFILPIANFGKFKVFGCTINAGPITQGTWAPITLITSRWNPYRVQTSSLSPDRKDFVLTWIDPTRPSGGPI